MDIQLSRKVVIPLTGSTFSHFVTVSSQNLDIFVTVSSQDLDIKHLILWTIIIYVNDWKWDVIVRFIDIGGIVDH